MGVEGGVIVGLDRCEEDADILGRGQPHRRVAAAQRQPEDADEGDPEDQARMARRGAAHEVRAPLPSGRRGG